MESIVRYFPQLAQGQIAAFQELGPLYNHWNQKINVISRKDIDSLYTNHVLHSLAIAKYVSFKKGEKILDVGTGGGFPGIPLAIMFPDANFLLVDSIGKKIKVVQSIIDSLKLTNCKAEQKRAESVHGKFNFIVSRAVAPLPEFVTWVQKKSIQPAANDNRGGIMYLKGGDIHNDLPEAYSSTIINISSFFEEPYFETKKIVHIVFARKD